nr:MAG TPA_asm: hypothetical protein [Caudoviricetes sp.]
MPKNNLLLCAFRVIYSTTERENNTLRRKLQ